MLIGVIGKTHANIQATFQGRSRACQDGEHQLRIGHTIFGRFCQSIGCEATCSHDIIQCRDRYKKIALLPLFMEQKKEDFCFGSGIGMQQTGIWASHGRHHSYHHDERIFPRPLLHHACEAENGKDASYHHPSSLFGTRKRYGKLCTSERISQTKQELSLRERNT